MQLTPRIITPPERRLDDSVQLTPRVLTPPEKERSPWSFVPSPLTKFMKRKAPQPLISLKPKKSKNHTFLLKYLCSSPTKLKGLEGSTPPIDLF